MQGGELKKKATHRLRIIVDNLPGRRKLGPEEREERDRLVHEIHATCQRLFARYGEVRQSNTRNPYDDVALMLQRAGGIETGPDTMRYRVIEGAVAENDGNMTGLSIMTPVLSQQEHTYVIGRTDERFTRGFLVVTPTSAEIGQIVTRGSRLPISSLTTLTIHSHGEPRLEDARRLHTSLSSGVQGLLT